MNHALYVAKTGLEAQQTRLTTISNNLANSNTYAYKAGRAEFQDLMYQNVRQAGAQATQDETNTLPSGLQIGTGVQTVGVQKMYTQGNLIMTENQFDLAVEGKGFFRALDQNGNEMYTRDGSFQVNQNGDMVTSSGYLVQPNIQIPQDASSVTVGKDGTVYARIPGQAQEQNIGQITLSTFVNPAGLESIGGNFLRETAASGVPNETIPGENSSGTVLQGALESSNVNTVEELIGMIEAQRTYEMNSKAISAADGMMQYLNNNT